MSQQLSLDGEAVLDAWLTSDVWPRRIIAFLADMVTIAALGVVIFWVIAVFGILTLGLGFMLLHFIWLIPPVYYITSLCSTGAATPGQRLVGLTVRQDETLDQPMPDRPTFAQALAWSVLLGVSFALFMLPVLLVLFTRRRRAAHDLLSGLTLVHASALNRASSA